ncbi:hypothetical protein [Chlorobium ferrooxidans]|uniref:Uncharacterized protein n=1 Tax=Chlorobium ferrooxidans DSM 13031 TaxID=377431 RepID=Q0YRP1_9CHLB|nr:hypothetical protein [Chlorobium ferrooxidans]EAT58999.1 hypothetical protein CferDRAFT_0973 [Chlorobium ferrooxidans DSM 13031]
MNLARLTAITGSVTLLLLSQLFALQGSAFAENSLTVQTKVTVNISESLIEYLNKLRKKSALKNNNPASATVSKPSPADTTSVSAQ